VFTYLYNMFMTITDLINYYPCTCRPTRNFLLQYGTRLYPLLFALALAVFCLRQPIPRGLQNAGQGVSLPGACYGCSTILQRSTL
jgi:hypothetical protein